MTNAFQAYAQNKEKEINDLVESHLPLVKKIVSMMTVYLPSGFDRDDLYSLGCWGLLDAARKFDPTKGVSFKTYSYIRIKGTIIDELRRNTFGGQVMVKKQQELLEAIKQAQQKKQGAVTEEDIAAELGVSKEKIRKMIDQTSTMHISSMDEQEFEIKSSSKVEEELEYNEQRAILVKAVENLPENEKMVISLYYQEEMSLKEIGEVLGVSESRVSQLHKKAILSIRAVVK